jgi:hypothetical protein
MSNDEIKKKYTEGFKNKQLKEWVSKLKYKINFIFNWRVKFKKNSKKKQKEIKEWG